MLARFRHRRSRRRRPLTLVASRRCPTPSASFRLPLVSVLVVRSSSFAPSAARFRRTALQRRLVDRRCQFGRRLSFFSCGGARIALLTSTTTTRRFVATGGVFRLAFPAFSFFWTDGIITDGMLARARRSVQSGSGRFRRRGIDAAMIVGGGSLFHTVISAGRLVIVLRLSVRLRSASFLASISSLALALFLLFPLVLRIIVRMRSMTFSRSILFFNTFFFFALLSFW